MNRNHPFISGVTSDVTSREKNLLVTANTLGKIFSGKLEVSLNFDNKSKAGLFRFDSTSSGGPSEVASGYLLVYTPNPDYDTTGIYHVRQLVYDDSSCAVFTRVGTAATPTSTISWSSWVGIAGIDDYNFALLSDDTYGAMSTYYRSYNTFVLTLPDATDCIQGARIALEQGENMGIVINSNKNYHASDYLFDNVSNLLFQQKQETKDGKTIYRWVLIPETETALYNKYKTDTARRPGGSVWPNVTIEYIEPETIVDTVYPTRFVAYVSKDKNNVKQWLVELVDDSSAAIKQIVSNINEATEHLELQINKAEANAKAYADQQDLALKAYVDNVVKPMADMKDYIDAGDANVSAQAQAAVAELKAYTDNADSTLKSYVDLRDQDARTHVDYVESTLSTKIDTGDTFLKNYTDNLFSKIFKGEVATNVNFNTLSDSKLIRFDESAINGPIGVTSGYALVFSVDHSDPGISSSNIRQMVYPDKSSAVYTREGHIESDTTRTWTDWIPYGDPGSFSTHKVLKLSDTAAANTYYISAESNVLTLPNPADYPVGTKIALEQVDFTGVVIASDIPETTIGRKMFDKISNILFEYVAPGCWTSVEDVKTAARKHQCEIEFPIKNDKIEYVSPYVIKDVKLPRRFTTIIAVDQSGNKYWESQSVEDASEAITSIMNFVIDTNDTTKKYADSKLEKSKEYTDTQIAEIDAKVQSVGEELIKYTDSQISLVTENMDTRFNSLTVKDIGSSGFFLTSVAQKDGKISAKYQIVKADMVQRESGKNNVFGDTVEDALVHLNNVITTTNDPSASGSLANHIQYLYSYTQENFSTLNAFITEEAETRRVNDWVLLNYVYQKMTMGSPMSVAYTDRIMIVGKQKDENGAWIPTAVASNCTISQRQDLLSMSDASCQVMANEYEVAKAVEAKANKTTLGRPDEITISTDVGGVEVSGFKIGRNDLVDFGATTKVAVESAVKAYVEAIVPVTPEATGKMDKVQNFAENDIVVLTSDGQATPKGNAKSSEYKIGTTTASNFGTVNRVATELGTKNFVADAIKTKMPKIGTDKANTVLIASSNGEAISSNKVLGEVEFKTQSIDNKLVVKIPNTGTSATYTSLSGTYTLESGTADTRIWTSSGNKIYMVYKVSSGVKTPIYWNMTNSTKSLQLRLQNTDDPITSEAWYWTTTTNTPLLDSTSAYSEKIYNDNRVATEACVVSYVTNNNRKFHTVLTLEPPDNPESHRQLYEKAVFGRLYHVISIRNILVIVLNHFAGESEVVAKLKLGYSFFVLAEAGTKFGWKTKMSSDPLTYITPSTKTLYEFTFVGYSLDPETSLVESSSWVYTQQQVTEISGL